MTTAAERQANATTVANKLEEAFALAKELGVTITVDTDDNTYKTGDTMAREDSTMAKTGNAVVTICTEGKYDDKDINWDW